MSRGPGRVQQSILTALASQAGDACLNQLCWQLASPQGLALPPGFYKSFRRAVDHLADAGRVTRSRRRLRDLEEVVQIYPSKARSSDIKQLRERLLPVVKSYLEESGDRKFGAAEVELYLLRKHPPSAETLALWETIEGRLLAHGVQASEEAERRALIAVLSKGRSLFVQRSRDVSGSFGAAIKDFLSTSLATRSSDLATDLKNFYNACFDRKELQRAMLKDRLYAVVDFTSNRTEALNDEFKRQLLQREPDYVRSLPGHAQQEARGSTSLGRVTFSKLLNSLLKRDVLSEFVFLSLP